MTISIMAIIGGIVIAVCLVLLVYYAIIASHKTPSIISWLLIGVMGIILAVAGTRLCMAIDFLVSAGDEADDIETIVNDTANGISEYSHQFGLDEVVDAGEAIETIKNAALGGTKYLMETYTRQAKRTLWRSLLWIFCVTIAFGVIAVLLAEKSTRGKYVRSHDRVRSRHDSVRGRRRR